MLPLREDLPFSSPGVCIHTTTERLSTLLPATCVNNFVCQLQTEYRNKCEFLIGVGADGQDKTVGFRLGKYKGGSCAVVGPGETIHVPPETKKVVQVVQDYIR